MFDMYQALKDGRHEVAAAIHRQLNPIFNAIFSVPSPAPVKAVYNEWGLDVGEPRLPLVSCNKEEKENILTSIALVVKN